MTIAQLITEYVGPRCDDYEAGCAVCDAWTEYDALVKHRKENEMEEEMWQIVGWLNTLPVEAQITIIKALCNETPMRVNTAAVQDFARRNGKLLVAWSDKRNAEYKARREAVEKTTVKVTVPPDVGKRVLRNVERRVKRRMRKGK